MAGWDQGVGGSLVTHNGELVTHDGLPVTFNDGTGWESVALAKTALAAAFAQSATWDAAGIETQPGAGGWEQTATWDALGQQAEPVSAEATFDQEAASWLAASSELAVGAATFLQDATWESSATEFLSGEATFAQSATWDAEGEQAAESEPVEAAGEWSQGAGWSASVTAPSAEVVGGFLSRRPQRIRLNQQPIIAGRSSFGQGPGQWLADVTVDRMPADIEELLLAGVL